MKLNKISAALPWLTLDFKMSVTKFFTIIPQAADQFAIGGNNGY